MTEPGSHNGGGKMKCGETPWRCPEGPLGKRGVRPGPLLGFVASQSWELLPTPRQTFHGLASSSHTSAVVLNLAL